MRAGEREESMPNSVKSLSIFIAAAALVLVVVAASLGVIVAGFALMALGGNGLLFLVLGIGGLAFVYVFTARVVLPFGRLVLQKNIQE